VPCQFIDPLRESFGDEVLEGRGKEIQTAVEGFVARQRAEPCAPMAARLVVDAPLLIKALHVAEQINGYEFLVRQKGAEVTQSSIFQVGLVVVSPADAQVESDELLFHKLNSTPLPPPAFLLLIRINNPRRMISFVTASIKLRNY
jgi:hypothetical protein